MVLTLGPTWARSLLRPKSLPDWPSGIALASVCAAGLIGILVLDLETPAAVTLGGLTFIFVVIGALWLSARLTWMLITGAVLLRILAILSGAVAVWTGASQILGTLLVGSAIYLAALALRAAQTERKTAAAAVDGSNALLGSLADQLGRLLNTSRTLATSLDPQVICEEAVRLAASILSGAGTMPRQAALYEALDRRLVCVCAFDDSGSPLVRASIDISGDSSAARAMARGQPVITSVAEDPTGRAICAVESVWVSVPAGGGVSRVLQVTRAGAGWDIQELRLLQALAELTGIAIQRSRLAKELRASDERFGALVDGVQDYAIFWLDPAGHVTSWNQGAERIKGYRADEIIGRHFSTFYPAEAVAAGKPAQELTLAEQQGRFEEEGWRLRKDGSRFWANVLITALHDGAGRLRGFAKITRDITERKRMQDLLLESERREAAKFHELADRLAALEQMKSRFMNLASHELRTPMSLIRGYVSMFEAGDLGTLNDDGKRAVSVLSARTQEINLLIEQMLEAARLEEGSLTIQQEGLDFRDVVIEAVDSFRRSSGTDHRLSVATPDDAVRIVADRRRIGSVLQTLLDNAIKYSPQRGEVVCELRTVAGWAEVKVRDNGLGLDAEQIDQLFRPFGRIVTPETAHIGGTDLGLYLSRELTRLQGGDITVESERGAGSTFTLKLPLALIDRAE